jgi:hypothetical protein
MKKKNNAASFHGKFFASLFMLMKFSVFDFPHHRVVSLNACDVTQKQKKKKNNESNEHIEIRKNVP